MSKSDRTEQGRRLAESLRRAAEIAEGEGEHEIRVGPRVLPREAEGFRDGVEAQRHLREHVCPNGETSPLGPYIPVPQPESTVAIGGKGAYALFPAFFLQWFERQRPESLAALDSVARREIRRAIVHEVLRENWLRASAAAAAVFAAVHWGADTLVWINGHLPALKALWQAIHSGTAP